MTPITAAFAFMAAMNILLFLKAAKWKRISAELTADLESHQ